MAYQVVRVLAYTRHCNEQLTHGLAVTAKSAFSVILVLDRNSTSRGGVALQGAQDVSAMTWVVDGMCVIHDQASGRPYYPSWKKAEHTSSPVVIGHDLITCSVYSICNFGGLAL